MTLTALLTVIGLAIAGIFTALFEAFKSGENNKENEYNKIENEQLKEQTDDIEEWKKTSNYIDSLSPDELSSKLRDWKESEKNNQSR